MFLDVLRRRNPALIQHAIALHQAGRIPANCYVIDLDSVEANARTLGAEAEKHGLKIFAMTKQMGRNADYCAAIARGGIGKAVAVDMECARACHRAGLGIGHLGHLVQVPRAEAEAAARLRPDFWTVFNLEQAERAGHGAAQNGREQPLLARIAAAGDTFYRGHEGGFSADAAVSVATTLDAVAGARFAGIVTFPALLFDPAAKRVVPTPNLATLGRVRDALARAGRDRIEVNAPGTTSAAVIGALAAAGATQVEPGHALTGTTPLHVVEDLPELPAVAYLTEVSHQHGGRAYCFGGGLYIDPVFPDYEVRAIVSAEPTVDAAALAPVEIPLPAAIDYYGMIDTASRAARVGDSVVFGFRPQVFVTRAYTMGLAGLRSGSVRIGAVHDAFGRAVDWPG